MPQSLLDTNNMSDHVRISYLMTALPYLSTRITGPACRAPLAKDKLFSRTAFEPADEDILPSISVSNSTMNMKAEQQDGCIGGVRDLIDGTVGSTSKVFRSSISKASRKKRAARRVLDSDDFSAPEDVMTEDDDLRNFIAYSDEDEDETFRRRAITKRLGKRRSNAQSENDDPEDGDAMDVDSDVIFGPDKSISNTGQIRTLSKLLPSTKMKVCKIYLHPHQIL